MWEDVARFVDLLMPDGNHGTSVLPEGNAV